MDVFALRKHIIDDYEAYTRSFLTIQDQQIAQFVQAELSGGKLWPEVFCRDCGQHYAMVSYAAEARRLDPRTPDVLGVYTLLPVL